MERIDCWLASPIGKAGHTRSVERVLRTIWLRMSKWDRFRTGQGKMAKAVILYVQAPLWQRIGSRSSENANKRSQFNAEYYFVRRSLAGFSETLLGGEWRSGSSGSLVECVEAIATISKSGLVDSCGHRP